MVEGAEDEGTQEVEKEWADAKQAEEVEGEAMAVDEVFIIRARMWMRRRRRQRRGGGQGGGGRGGAVAAATGRQGGAG